MSERTKREIAEQGWNFLAATAFGADASTWPIIEAVADILFKPKQIRLTPAQVKLCLLEDANQIPSRLEELTFRLNLKIAEIENER